MDYSPARRMAVFSQITKTLYENMCLSGAVVIEFESDGMWHCVVTDLSVVAPNERVLTYDEILKDEDALQQMWSWTVEDHTDAMEEYADDATR